MQRIFSLGFHENKYKYIGNPSFLNSKYLLKYFCQNIINKRIFFDMVYLNIKRRNLFRVLYSTYYFNIE